MSAAVIEAASEQPASRSGISTVLSGFSNLAVSAMKWTPASTITWASVRAASRASARLSPTMSATVWKMSGDLVVMREHDRVALALEPQDRGDIVGQDRPFEGRDVPLHAPVEIGQRHRGRGGRSGGGVQHDLSLCSY